MMRPKIKICGIVDEESAKLSYKAGVDFIGLVIDIPYSPRNLTFSEAKKIRESAVLPVLIVLADSSLEKTMEYGKRLFPYGLQLAGDEHPSLVEELKGGLGCMIWKSIHLPRRDEEIDVEREVDEKLSEMKRYVEAGVDIFVLDTSSKDKGIEKKGGTGSASNWKIAAEIVKRGDNPIFLAGGINPDNILAAIDLVRPYGIDLASGVEKGQGSPQKDPYKLKRLMEIFQDET